MPIAAAAPFIGAGLSGLGSIFSNTKGARTSTSTPTWGPEFQPIVNALQQHIMERLNSGGLPKGFEEQGISGVNNVYKNITQSLGNRLASMGLTGSPVAGNVYGRSELNRAGDISRWETSLPTMAREFQNQDFNTASNFLNLGRGTTNVGAGSAPGAGLGSFGSMLGYLSGAGAFPSSGGGGLPPDFGPYSNPNGPYTDVTGRPDPRVFGRG